MAKEKSLSEPNPDKDGRIWADEGPSHYIVAELPDGSERFSIESNALFMIHSLAEDFSVGTPGFTKTVRIVRSDTHEAIFRYREGRGLQEGWKEKDPKRAERRRLARERKEKFVFHNQDPDGEEKDK